MQEIWKDIKGYEGIYQVSNLGNVKSIHKSAIKDEYALKQKTINPKGYYVVSLTLNRKCIVKPVHRLVAEAFIPNFNNYKEINHIDGNKLNNCFDNLEWCTRSYNISHAWNTGLMLGASKPILQLDKSNILIKRWRSIEQAGNNLNISKWNITSCVKNKRKTAGGFIWKYAD